MRRTVAERLYGRLETCIDPACNCDCRLWGGALTWNGYGRVHVNGKFWRVHRLAYTLEVGPIPDGLDIDHVWDRGCRHRHCANVAHLEPVTRRENLLRSPLPIVNSRRISAIAARNAAKTHCSSGHEFDDANTYRRPGGGRSCRACHRRWDRERNQRKRRPAA